jgi:hypothetical protein
MTDSLTGHISNTSITKEDESGKWRSSRSDGA